MNKRGKPNPMVERAVRWIIIMLLAEFVLGVMLTTVINYSPHKHDTVQTVFLFAHILIAIALTIGSIAHIITSRSSHLLGQKPVIGFIFILGAFISGGFAASSGSSVAVLFMALFFGAAIVTYGLSYLAVKTATKN